MGRELQATVVRRGFRRYGFASLPSYGEMNSGGSDMTLRYGEAPQWLARKKQCKYSVLPPDRSRVEQLQQLILFEQMMLCAVQGDEECSRRAAGRDQRPPALFHHAECGVVEAGRSAPVQPGSSMVRIWLSHGMPVISSNVSQLDRPCPAPRSRRRC